MLDIVVYLFNRVLLFGCASMPIISVFLMLFLFKVSPKISGVILLVSLLQCVEYWVRVGDLGYAAYHLIPYIVGFIIIYMRHKGK